MQWNRATICLWHRKTQRQWGLFPYNHHHVSQREVIQIVTNATLQKHTQWCNCLAKAFPACVPLLALYHEFSSVLTYLCREFQALGFSICLTLIHIAAMRCKAIVQIHQQFTKPHNNYDLPWVRLTGLKVWKHLVMQAKSNHFNRSSYKLTFCIYNFFYDVFI